ncbi:hypothetical protein [Oscillatoria salina]|uniref:hypothetical protein n=1 Tax=Oscillatoria salina TaxID=331517 RepID=UPI0013B7466D|nr:hypothetical protein [Oscillatoria salina]MBZ8181916.1 hypothetical protein [Oscillatoria salina IIICB1]NET91401.1 hypothetical protein [Kamptonema sp. SIO1D9]
MNHLLKARRISYFPSDLSSYQEIGVKYYSLVADGYQLVFGLTSLPMMSENQLVFKVKLIIRSRSNNFELLNNFTLKQLWNLVNQIEKHFDFSETEVNQDSEKSTLILENGTLQIEIQSKTTIVSKTKYIIHNLLVTVVNSQTEFMKPFLGVKGTITFNEVSRFAFSMREVLTAFEI